MLYLVDSEHFCSFLKESQKQQQRWEKKFGPFVKPQTADPEKMSYIQMINSNLGAD